MTRNAPSAGEAELLEKVNEMTSPFDEMGRQIHEIVSSTAPTLTPRTWYGMPAYEQDGKTVCFFRQDDSYMTFGFTEKVDLVPDEKANHQLIPAAWFVTDLDEATKAELAEIVQQIAE